MAESKTTPYIINKDPTECGICLCTIEEPTELPCLHTYCLKCLTRYAEGKTDTIRCPVCVKEFPIPSDGIKAFTTNTIMNTLNDRKSEETLHAMGHRKEIEQLMQDCEGVKNRTENAMDMVRTASDELNTNATKAKEEINESFNKALKLLEDNRDQLKIEVDKAAAIKKEQLDAQMDEIQVLQARLQTALQMATEVVKTGSDDDLALVSTLKTNLMELRDLKLVAFDQLKAVVYFEPAHISEENAQKLVSVLTLVKQHKEEVGVWTLDRSFGNDGAGKLKCGRGVAITQEGDIAVADRGDSAVKIYKKDGQFKSSIKIPGSPWNVVVSSDDKLFVTNQTKTVSVYDGKGNLKHQFPTTTPDNISSDDQRTKHMGLAIDNYYNLLVGETTQKYISKHRLDGTHIMSFKAKIKPWYITVSRDDKIIISKGGDGGAVHILDNNGVHLETLQSPEGLGWNPLGMCCTSTNEIYISNSYTSGKSAGICCYSARSADTSAAYIGCLTKDVRLPAGLVLIDNEEKLIVIENYRIKIYKLKP
ncbi:uncharacterized protein [Amphiura filiformis]|uniref:uncharacterized protein n=1 Tax=Amphiura filiformis TaxID=82378 RepID=UPI003B222F66